MFRLPAARVIRPTTSLLSATTRRAQPQCLAVQQSRQQHAVSNPTLANIEKRWEQMPPQEQAELWMALRDRMTVDWHELTMQEKKACECNFTLLSVLAHRASKEIDWIATSFEILESIKSSA